MIRETPHRRLNPLKGEWVIVSPHRTKRPWKGARESSAREALPEFDPDCYLCPCNKRANGERNPAYSGTYVFRNDFAALVDTPEKETEEQGPLFHERQARGECRVICFSPRHDLTLPRIALSDIRQIVDLWAAQTLELSEKYAWVQVFENKGSVMECSNPHPHGQVWAGDFIPNEIAAEDRCQRTYLAQTGSPLLTDYLTEELRRQDRIVTENEHWVALVPFWALWPFETLALPRRATRTLPELSDPERDGLAAILKSLLTRYDNLFETSFPYSMGWHGAPYNNSDPEPWLLHAHFYPPLLRSATVKKFMVGYEMLAEPQRDITPEEAAERLRGVSERHFLS